MLYNRLRKVEDEETTSYDYDSTSWAFKQADRNGRKAVIRDLIRALTVGVEVDE